MTRLGLPDRQGRGRITVRGTAASWNGSRALLVHPRGGNLSLISPMPGNDQSSLLNTCPECGEVIDVSHIGPYEKVPCPSCAELIRVRTRFDHFEIKRLLGEGGMSQVFVAEDTKLGRDVALKILHPYYTKNTELTNQFEREARLTASISHPNVVKVYSVGRDQEYFYIAMELVEGTSLEHIIQEEETLDEARALEIAIQVAQGLRAAHQTGLIHRDIKPGNILLSKHEVAKIVDFGLALVAGKDVDESNVIWATPYYVPPEKLHDEPEDFRSDVYSLGASLFHALAGKPPFSADTSSLEDLKRMKSKAVSLKNAAPHITESTCRVIDRMLSRKPKDRQQDYQELLAELNSARTLIREGVTEEAHRPYSQRMLFLVAVLFLCFAGYLLLNTYGPDPGRSLGRQDTLAMEEYLKEDSLAGSDSAREFAEARALLLDGEPGEAIQRFRSLASTPGVSRSTLSWTFYNMGVSFLLEGKMPASRQAFAALEEKALYAGMPEDDEVTGFFLESAAQLKRDLPVMEEVLDEAQSTGVGAMAWLAYGLKNWQHGRYEEAGTFFEAFRQSTPPKQLEWIHSYLPLLDDFFSDAKMIETMPRPRSSMNQEELATALSRYEELEGALRTKGSGVRLLKDRQSRARFFQTQLQNETAKIEEMRVAEKQRLAEERKTAEMEALRELIASLESLGPAREFSEALDVLGGAEFSDPEVLQLRKDQERAWTEASGFTGTLIADLNVHGYRGEILREGVPALTGTISGATADVIHVRLEFGETTLPFSSVSADGLLLMAKQIFGGLAAGEDRERRIWKYIFFARQTGVKEAADSAAKSLVAANEEFRTIWERLGAPGPAAAPAVPAEPGS